jgi:uncharacterized YigZ family protein
MDDVYYTINVPARSEIKVKGSRFIAETGLAGSVGEVDELLRAVRKREHAATHHCKYSDDGEPSGTAGRPIYEALCGRHLTNVLLVVTRYFGGTKLGTGGLARAYGQAAAAVLGQSGVKENHITETIQVELDFSQYDQLLKTVHRLGATQRRADFSDRVVAELEIRRSKADELASEVAELSNGKAIITRGKS